MHTAILCVYIGSNPSRAETERLKGFLGKCDNILSKASNILRLDETSWRIPLQSDLHIFAALVAAAESSNISYRTALFVDKDTAWFERTAKEQIPQ